MRGRPVSPITSRYASPPCSSPVTSASTASIGRRRRRANSRSPLTTSPPTAPSAYSSAATCGDASSNSTGRPIENWRRPTETRAAAGPGAGPPSEMMMAVMRERLKDIRAIPAQADVSLSERVARRASLAGLSGEAGACAVRAHLARILARPGSTLRAAPSPDRAGWHDGLEATQPERCTLVRLQLHALVRPQAGLHTVLPLPGINEGRCRAVEPLRDTHGEPHPDGEPGRPDPRQLVLATAKFIGKLSPAQLPVASACIESLVQCLEVPPQATIWAS
jgi:hypothetical protein